MRCLLGLWVVLGGAAWATPGPWSDAPLDPAGRLIDRLGRAQGADMLYGARHIGPLGLAHRWARIEGQGALLAPVLAPEIGAGGGAPHWTFRPIAGVAAGEVEPALQGGYTEPGWVSARAGGLLSGAWGAAAAFALPEVRGQLGAEADPLVGLGVPEAWAGLHTPAWQVGFGRVDRWFGPGRHGGLMLTDNARPAPLGSAAWEGRLGARGGRLRAELGAGWLDRPRDDVQRPGWLLADLRWAPVPMFEMGATRLGIFGGVGRPAPPLGQLLLPTDPHVVGDPDRLLPDQDEIAALDGRLTLPLGEWTGRKGTPGMDLGLDYLELYIQYGGEDLIAREIVGIPVPALAGVANLYGFELGLGALVLDLEHARMLDDRFRWYTGHRIYHRGFTQDGRVMGHPAGGDAHSTSTAVRWFPGEWGVESTYDHVLQVGVASVEGDHVQALMADTRIDRFGLRGWWLRGGHRWLQGGLVLERTANSDFLPGPAAWAWRVAIGR